MKTLLEYINENKKINFDLQFTTNSTSKNWDGEKLANYFWDKYDLNPDDFEEYLKETFFAINNPNEYYDTAVVDPWKGNDYFILSLYDGKHKFLSVKVKYFKNIGLYQFDFGNESGSNVVEEIEYYINKYNGKYINNIYKKAGLSSNSKSNSIEIDEYVNNKLKETKVLKGTIDEIFNEFTKLNDKLSYVNDHYYKFKNENVRTAYNMYVKFIDKNHTLKNALKRGVTID